VTPGAISLNIANHLPTMPASTCSMPVGLPPGFARLAMNPAPIGSETFTNTIGTLLLFRCTAAAAGVVCARITSGSIAMSSLARDSNKFSLPPANR
jgi:hypothetical protein